LNIKTSTRSTSSLSFTWYPPGKDKQNGVSYTACVSQSENGSCFRTYITNEREWIVRNLNASTKYYVRVLVSNKAGSSAYSGSKGFFTNGSKYNLHIWILYVVKKTVQNLMFAYFYTVQKPGSRSSKIFYSLKLSHFPPGAAKKATEVTSSTLTFSLEIPSKTFV
jgi:hypothetical protein